jgi:hypothetical protein
MQLTIRLNLRQIIIPGFLTNHPTHRLSMPVQLKVPSQQTARPLVIPLGHLRLLRILVCLDLGSIAQTPVIQARPLATVVLHRTLPARQSTGPLLRLIEGASYLCLRMRYQPLLLKSPRMLLIQVHNISLAPITSIKLTRMSRTLVTPTTAPTLPQTS